MYWKSIALVGVLASLGCVDLDFNMDQGVKGSGKIVKEHRSVSGFSKIEMKGAYDVDVQVGPATSVDITGDDNLLKLITTNVEKGTLVLSTKKNINSKKSIKVTITTPALSAFILKGAGDVNIEGLKGDTFSVDLHGAGDLTARGEVNNLKTTLKGAGDMNLYGLKAQDVTAELSGAGDMDVWASNYLKATMSGVGELSYKGHPKQVDKKSSGIGSIENDD